MSNQAQLAQICMNQSRVAAARWIYKFIEVREGLASAQAQINGLAAEGWEVHLMIEGVILLRRDVSGSEAAAVGDYGGEDRTRDRLLLTAIANRVQR